MSHIESQQHSKRQAVVAMDIDSLVDTDHQVVPVVDGGPLPQVLQDQYCFMCCNGGELAMCDSAKCSRAICIGPDAQCFSLPADMRFKRQDVLFICPPCHQDNDRKSKPTPYYGFYVAPGPHTHLNKTQTHWAPPGSELGYDYRALKPLYESPAKVRGSAQIIPRSKFLSNGIAILNFRLNTFRLDTGDLGKILRPFATAFFPEEDNLSLIFEDILYNLGQHRRKHNEKIHSVVRKLRASSTLKTVIILITTHAEDGTGHLAISSSLHANTCVNINEWMTEVVTGPLLDVIRALDSHWFFLCCGALVNIPSSMEMVRSFAYALKPANLFAFDAPSFHPIYATTFLINFFQHIIIEGRTFDSAISLLVNNSALSRHSGIVRFWVHGLVVRHCTLKWVHSRTRPWGNPVPYQCPSCYCIQTWDQKGKGDSSELRGDVTMRCSYKDEQGRCGECLTFVRPSESYKPVKLLEGIWVTLGYERSNFL